MDRVLARHIAPRLRSAVSARATLFILLAIAVATRLQIFGNPILYSDEQLYALIGSRLLDGDIPYVDIWDRKPVGLFILYAAMQAISGGSVLGYQIIATLFAAATAFVIARIARDYVGGYGATGAGVAYLAWINLGSAGGGQSPIFYNLPMAVAALVTMRAVQGRLQPFRTLAGAGAGAMMLVGLAMQIKYTVVFEGVFFGLALLYAAYKSGQRLVSLMFLCVGVALLPTLAAAAAYAALGHLDSFIHANFLSILGREGVGGGVAFQRLGLIALVLAPLVACALYGARGRMAENIGFRFVVSWLGAAIIGVLSFGTYLHHYLLPALVPATAAAAAMFDLKRIGRAIMIPLVGGAAIAGQLVIASTVRSHGSTAQFEQIVRATGRKEGCLFVYAPYAALYRFAGTCIPTRFAFASHLARRSERRAIGTDQLGELSRIMRSRPTTVVLGSPYSDQNEEARRVLTAALGRDYRLIRTPQLGKHRLAIFRLKPTADLAPR